MIPIPNYGLHEHQGSKWLVQSSRKNTSAIGLPDEPIFEATLPVHPRALAMCPHVYDLAEPEPSTKEFYDFMQFVNANPILRYFLPRTHFPQVMPLIAVDYTDLHVVSINLDRLLTMHPSVEPFTFPMQHFDQRNRPIAIEAARTNLLPLVVTGFTPWHLRKLDRYATALLMVPRTVIIICPVQVFGPPPFKLFTPGCLATPEFTNFLKGVDLRAIGTHYLRRFMRGEL